MRIGLVIYGSLDTVSGGYLYDRKLVDYLRSQGETVEIISLPWRNYTAHLLDNVFFRLPADLDLIIQDELNHPSLIAANQGKHRYPIVSLVHHLRSSELRPAWENTVYRFVEKQYLQSVDGFIFNSRTTEKVVNQLIENRKPSVIGYPPTDRFSATISEEEIMQRAEIRPLRILFLGNVIYRKGLHTLLQAVSTLRAAVKVDVIGSLKAEPVYVKLVTELIAKHQLSSAVVLHGALEQAALAQHLQQAHVLVVPSSYEGYGIAYLEGMGFGLPAIGTTAGAAGEIIEPGKTGYLIPPDDASALAQYLDSLMEDRDLLRRLSFNARARYLRQPAWVETAKNIHRFLRSFVP